MRQLMTLAFVLVAMFVAQPAMAAGYYWDEDQNDNSGMCRDLTGNWVSCSSTGGGGGGGTTSTTCKNSVCWYCDYDAGRVPQTYCGQTGAPVGGPMGCDCGTSSNGECDLKNTKCTII